ncbi:hypothetical protein, partial [Faecalibaculum rodentium]|uniref:hypothetical protein n=1 Tax=Faecalibaculum rodentium TaxID=1702221 RepID=UPI00263B6C7F
VKACRQQEAEAVQKEKEEEKIAGRDCQGKHLDSPCASMIDFRSTTKKLRGKNYGKTSSEENG